MLFSVTDVVNSSQFYFDSQINKHVVILSFYFPRYSLFNGAHIILFIFNRQIILCRVTLGKPFFQFTAVKMAHAPPGHHSVVGKPNSGGLSYPEYVVYRGEQVIDSSVTFVKGPSFAKYAHVACFYEDRGYFHSAIAIQGPLRTGGNLRLFEN